MLNEPYERMLQEYLRGEFRVLNAHITLEPKTLAELLKETYPSVRARDGSSYLFKRRELEYLASFLSPDEQESLLLPLTIEVIAGEEEISILNRGEIELKIVSQVLGMPVSSHKGRVKLYKPQLAELRRVLRTATQYVFSPRLPEELKPQVDS